MGKLEPHLFRMMGVADPKKHAPSLVCYHTNFGRCRSNHMSKQQGVPNNFGDAAPQLPWDGSVSDLRNTLLSICQCQCQSYIYIEQSHAASLLRCMC